MKKSWGPGPWGGPERGPKGFQREPQRFAETQKRKKTSEKKGGRKKVGKKKYKKKKEEERKSEKKEKEREERQHSSTI